MIQSIKTNSTPNNSNNNKIPHLRTYSTIIIYIIFSWCVFSASCLTVQINNIHNGYKYTIKGIPTIEQRSSLDKSLQKLILTNIQILQNTLPEQQNINQILHTQGSNSVILLEQLSIITELQPDSDYMQVISTNWIKKPYYTVTFILEEQDNQSSRNINYKVFVMIRDNTQNTVDENEVQQGQL